MKNLFLVMCVFVSACGPDYYGDCLDCQPGEDSAESKDGDERLPIVVVVNVNVNQNQSQSQNQSQAQVQGQINQTYGLNASLVDAGTAKTVDSGTPDAGKPDSGVKTDAGLPKTDAGKPDAGTCRKVCTCYVTVYKCSDGKTYDKKPNCNLTCKEDKKCTQEKVVCF